MSDELLKGDGSEQVLLSSMYWDVKIPPAKKRILAGKLMRTAGSVLPGRLRSQPMRVTMELHGLPRKEPELKKEAAAPPPKRGLNKNSPLENTARCLMDKASRFGDEFEDGDYVMIRFLKPKKKKFFRKNDDDSSSNDSESEGLGYDDFDEDEWTTYRKFFMVGVKDIVVDKNRFDASFGKGDRTEVREIFFEDETQRKQFHDAVLMFKQKRMDRAAKKMSLYKARRQTENAQLAGDAAVVQRGVLRTLSEDGERITLLVEIVSCVNLPIADRKSTDPYVEVFFGADRVHRTKTLQNTLDPIWTVSTGSMFVLSASSTDFFAAVGMQFVVCDQDALGNTILGKVLLTDEDLLKAVGKRQMLNIGLESNIAFSKTNKWLTPKLNVRVRKATAADKEFMETLKTNSKKNKMIAMYAKDAFVAPKAQPAFRLKRETKKSPEGRLYRVKPTPDPKRQEETTWLLEKQIHAESLKPSYEWTEAGSGNLGKVYVEVIGCDGLPNLDQTSKTDSFVCAIYEDAIVCSDVINDSLSPRWPPWSKRAFIFNVAHPSSQLLIGVFDYDGEVAVGGAHDPVGRVTVDITNMRADTEYMLHYQLTRSALDDNRKVYGTVTLRVRLEWTDFRHVFYAALKPPPANYINVAKMNDFRSAHFVCNGKERQSEFNTDLIWKYIDELKGLQSIGNYARDAIMTTVLWRGHFSVGKVKLPLHSIVAFTMGIFLVENLNYLPSFTLFSITWLLLSTLEMRSQNPSRWQRPHGLVDLWQLFLSGKIDPETIYANEDEAKIKEFKKAEEEKKKKAAELLETQKKIDEMYQAMLTEADPAGEAQNDDSGDLSADSKAGKGGLNPLKPYLYPYQIMLRDICAKVRAARSVVMWDESYYAFLLAAGCFVLGMQLLWVPWSSILRWIFRIIVWGCLGPWMKLVDMYYMKKEGGEIDANSMLEAQLAVKSAGIAIAKMSKMIQREDNMKLKALKKYMFGKFITRVPRFKEFKHHDFPLQTSSAKPVKPEDIQVNITDHKRGQTLFGPMVPTW